MRIKYNGEYEELTCDAITVDALANLKQADKEGLIVMVNKYVVKQEDWETHMLKDGDLVEFFTFVAGG